MQVKRAFLYLMDLASHHKGTAADAHDKVGRATTGRGSDPMLGEVGIGSNPPLPPPSPAFSLAPLSPQLAAVSAAAEEHRGRALMLDEDLSRLDHDNSAKAARIAELQVRASKGEEGA